MSLRRRFRRPDPMQALVKAMRVAAVQVDIPASRRIAKLAADSIPLTKVERAHGRRGEVASMARVIMRALPTMPPEDLAQAARELIDCRIALESRFEETSFVQFGKRRKTEPRTGI